MRYKTRKMKLLSVVLLIIPIFMGLITPDLTTPVKGYTTPRSEVWQVGDWVSYEVIALFAIQIKQTVIEVTPGYIEFMVNDNVSVTFKANITSIDDSSYNITDLFNTSFPVFNQSNLEDSEIILSFYESHALVHIDNNPTVIPVTGVIYEYSNISNTEPYNYTTFNWTDYSSETTLVQMHTNYSIQIEIHEPTGIVVNMLTTIRSNVTISLFEIPYGIGMYQYLTDSHGVFESSEGTKTESVMTETSETTTTNKTLTKTSIIAEAPYGLEIIGIALVGMACVYIRRRRKES